MKTDDLIAALAQDTVPVAPGRVGGRIALASLLAAAAALAVLMMWLGLRPDIHFAMRTAAFWMKAGYSLALGVAGFALTRRLGRPGGRLSGGVLLLVGLIFTALVMLGAHQLMLAPADQRMGQWLGDSWKMCPWRILALSAPAYLAIAWGLRGLAPTRLVLAGACAGLLAGGIGATVYGFYCQETAAAFVATWYTLGIAASAAIGALLGPRLLRW